MLAVMTPFCSSAIRGRCTPKKPIVSLKLDRANRGTLIHVILPLGTGRTHHGGIASLLASIWMIGTFVMATKHGRIKRVHLQDFADVRPSGLIAMGLNDDDYLGWVKYSNGDQDIMMVTEARAKYSFP